MFRSLLLACSALTLASTAFAADLPVSTANLSQHIKVLSSDAFEGRGIGTAGEEKTIAYVTEQFKKAGMQPGGPNGAWVQPVELARFEVKTPTAALNLGTWSKPLTPGEQIVISTRRPAERVDIAAAPLVFVGYGVVAPERNWNDYAGLDMKGKIAVVLVNDPDFEEPALNTFNGKAMTYYGRWTYKYEEAARQGAAGVMIVHETAPASYGWATVKNSWSTPQFDIVRANAAAERVPLESWIQRDVAVELFQRAGLDFEALKRQARRPGFKAAALPGATLSASYGVNSTRIKTHNILAKRAGSARPDETILYTAHWDHLGMGDPDKTGDAIFNGAIDNASGTAALIELARLYGAGPAPRRTVVLIAITAEESGLLGAEYYAANPVYPLEKTVAGFNMDALNVFGPMRNISVVGSGYSQLEDQLAKAAAGQNRTVAPDPTPEAGAFFRSDHFPLAKRGVPMLYAGGGDDLVTGGKAAAKAAEERYVACCYHQADDEWSPNWNLTGAAQDIALFYEMGRALANSTAWPNWNEGTEFRPTRDKTAAARATTR